MEKIAECCLKFRQEKCIESGIKSGKVVWGHLHEICVVDGQVDEEMINAYKNEQKKRDFNNDLSKIHVLTQKSTKLASSTKSIDKIQLGMRGSSKNTPGTVLINRLFLFLSLSQKSDNCSVHKGSCLCLDAIYLEANIQVKYLPPNMTYILQVLDLVVNGPIKAHIASRASGGANSGVLQGVQGNLRCTTTTSSREARQTSLETTKADSAGMHDPPVQINSG